MDQVPNFQIHEIVRVLQTDSMTNKGLANLRGRVIRVTGIDSHQICRILVGKNEFDIPSHSLEKSIEIFH